MDSLPKTNDEYTRKQYWDDRYTNDNGVFDWFRSFQDIQSIFEELIPDKSSRILMLGCGNSTLSEEMYDAGYTNIVNIDYSSIVISKMKQRTSARSGMTWQEMDVRNLAFADQTFEVAIDKGTMDAMLAVKGDVWDPPESAVQDCNKEVDEVLRVLRPDGLLLYLTFGQPHFRKRYLTKENTSLEVRTLGDMFHYFLYILRKAPR
ncbi:S-adenosyl-L-methionine-dependent methyltransferase, partial [Serendipita vermifera]